MKKFLTSRFRAFSNFEAWFMIVVGLVLFTMRVPFDDKGWVHLPMAVTVFQTAGLMFMLCGLQIFISILMWPNVRLKELLEQAEHGHLSAGVAAAGLMLFNGLSLVAQVIWLIYGTGARIGA